MAKSKEYFEQASALDSRYALAWHGLGLYYWWSGYLEFMRPKEANLECNRVTAKALKIDETLSEAHSLMAMLLAGEFDWKGSEKEFGHAIDLGPDSADIWANYSQFYLVPMLHLGDALAAAQKATKLDPLSPHFHWHVGHRYSLMRQYDRAIEQYTYALELDPQWYYAYAHRGLAYIHQGKIEEGLQSYETALRLMRQDPLILCGLAAAYGLASRTNQVRMVLDELQSLAQKKYVSAWAFANAYLALGEMEEFWDWIEKSADEHDIMMATMRVYRHFDSLRSHPRWKALLRKMNLETWPHASSARRHSRAQSQSYLAPVWKSPFSRALPSRAVLFRAFSA
jgi:adenylate cyclase